MKKSASLIIFSVLIGLASAAAKDQKVNCDKLAESVKIAITAEPSKLLEIVSREVAASQSCACEVVKAAIESSEPDVETVAAIAEVAILSAPEHMRLISQCAIASAPDALAEVLAVLAKYDPNAGESGNSAKNGDSSKGAKAPIGEVAAMPNPLDFPGQGPVLPLFPIFTPIIIGPSDELNPDLVLVPTGQGGGVIDPGPVTDVNPGP